MKPKKFKTLREHAEWLRHNVPFEKRTEAEKDICKAFLDEELKGIEEETINKAAEVQSPKERANIYAGGIEMMHIKVGECNTLSNSSASVLYPQYKCFDQNAPPKKSRDANLYRLQKIEEAKAASKKKQPDEKKKPETLEDILNKRTDGTTVFPEVMKLLRETNNPQTYEPYVKLNGGYIWDCEKIYLAGLINVLRSKGWINYTVSGPVCAEVLKTTFNIDKLQPEYFNPNGAKINGGAIDPKYMDCFSRSIKEFTP